MAYKDNIAYLVDFFTGRDAPLSRLRRYLAVVVCSIGPSLLAGCAGTPSLPPEIAAQPKLAEAAQRALGDSTWTIRSSL